MFHPVQGRGQDVVAPPTPAWHTTAPTPQQSFRRMDARIRAILQHNRHLPRVSTISIYLLSTFVSMPYQEMMTDLEEELRFLFSLDSQVVVLVLQSNP